MNIPKLAIIVPCYNEEECINDTFRRLTEILISLEKSKEIKEDSFLFFVNDGSNDKTWEKIEKLHIENSEKVKGISFSKNFGHQKAVLAGLLETYKYGVDCFISIDADLQQDEHKIKEFIQKYKQGAQIVAGIRNDRKTDSLLKKITALAFYKFMNLMGVNITVNHADYRLISRKAVEALKKFSETNLFLRGIFNELGFKRDYVYFDVKPRTLGKTKYTAKKMFSLAISGITSFSVVPLRIVSYMGILMSILSLCLGFYALWEKIVKANVVPGWATTIGAIGFLSGIQILCIGIMGEYIGQLLQEVKARPRYIVEKELD